MRTPLHVHETGLEEAEAFSGICEKAAILRQGLRALKELEQNQQPAAFNGTAPRRRQPAGPLPVLPHKPGK